MKICHFIHKNIAYWGVYKDARIYPFPDNKVSADFIINAADHFFETEEVEFRLPVSPSKIVCVGRNYAEHAAELGNEVPKSPLLFLKANSSLLADGDSIRLPEQSNQVEHEGELGVIISRECRKLTKNDNTFDYVLGYVCVNDVTARDIQRQEVQFTRAKSFDTFCPVGKFIETDLDVSDILVQTKVNGIIKQSGRTSQMVFPVEFLIRYISNQMTLFPGDLIATGTPSGVSKLTKGDICEIEIEGIGTLKNSVLI